jgi:hypothetical protein
MKTLKHLGVSGDKEHKEAEFKFAIKYNLHRAYWDDEKSLKELAFKVFPYLKANMQFVNTRRITNER